MFINEKGVDFPVFNLDSIGCIHNEPMPVTPKSVFAALRAADAEGRRRKADA